MNTNLALLLLAPFLGFLFNIFFGKVLEKQLLGSWDSYGCCFVCVTYFFGQIVT
jgi:NADH-quinone oxidoreductase subunit L